MYPIYCINLENRTDRKIHSINEFNKINILLDNVKYPHFIKDPRGGIYGCFDSHMKIWNDFYKNYPNEKYCLIFEDDFELVDDNFDKTIKETVEFIDKNYNYIDILNLHDYYYIDVNHNINNKLFTNGCGTSLHAYFITRHYIDSIITKYGDLPIPNGIHIDFSINFDTKSNLYTKNIFYTKNKCFNQMISKTDNSLNILRYTNNDINFLNNITKYLCLKGKWIFNLTDNDVKYIINTIYKMFI